MIVSNNQIDVKEAITMVAYGCFDCFGFDVSLCKIRCGAFLPAGTDLSAFDKCATSDEIDHAAFVISNTLKG